MKKSKQIFVFFVALFSLSSSGLINAQIRKISEAPTDKTISTKPWSAFWIALPDDPGKEYGVYLFRKNIELATKPETFLVKASADNRYKLYVNGSLVSVGPGRGDLYYWNYETIDLSPYLTKGKNTVSAIVWNDAQYRPEAQISLRTAFILQGNSKNEEVLNTGRSWKCFRDPAFSALPGIGYGEWYIADPGETVDMNKTVGNWMATDFDDTSWPTAKILDQGKPKGVPDAVGWMLVPSSLPQMERTIQRIPVLRKAEGATIPASFPSEKTAVTIPANTTATLLLDQTYLTTAYLTLNFSGGFGGSISVGYAETLFDNLKKFGTQKGNRNEVEGKDFAGRRDSIISNGGNGQSFNTRYWRTFRYIRLSVQTKDNPLVINDIYGTFTGYPFVLKASLQTENTEMKKILEIGWRTARLNALETYMDCPYYEQLQYIGDSRIQAMISYYNSGDDRLARNAISQMNHSRIAEGLSLSRHPSYTPQIIPTFSLWYIGVLHDYWMYRADEEFVKDKLEGVRSILAFYGKYQQADGSLRSTPYWNFVDWAQNKSWVRGTPPTGKTGGSAVLDLQLLIAYQTAADMENKIGMAGFANLYSEKADQLKKAIQNQYWDSSKGLYADNEDKIHFSQHANSLAILAGLGAPAEQLSISKKILRDTTLTQCTIYFKYYMHQALVKGQLGNDYMNWLDIWRDNIANGLTTWAEISDLKHTRSDCHAWGASPNIEFYRTVLGIDSDAPGFKKVKIEPHLGELQDNGGEIPHPEGKITVNYSQKNGHLSAKITLPSHTTGIFLWKGENHALKSGINNLEL